MKATIFVCYHPSVLNWDEIDKKVEELEKGGYAVEVEKACVRCIYSSMWCGANEPCPYER
jgi:hypothetical protein